MKIVMDEKLKHRLVGLAVIISIGTIFVPAMIKKSSQKLEDNFSVNIQLPKKPIAPDVAVKDEEELFQTIKVSRVKLPNASGQRQLPKLVQAEPIKIDDEVTKAALKVAKNEAIERPKIIAKSQAAMKLAAKPLPKATVAQKIVKKTAPVKVANTKQAPTKKPVSVVAQRPVISKQPIYAVQLASFANLNNAQGLVNRLKARGYKASFIRLSTTRGPIYKVYAGHSPSKNDVVKLKVQLASTMQLNGFVVNTGVS